MSKEQKALGVIVVGHVVSFIIGGLIGTYTKGIARKILAS